MPVFPPVGDIIFLIIFFSLVKYRLYEFIFCKAIAVKQHSKIFSWSSHSARFHGYAQLLFAEICKVHHHMLLADLI